MRRKRPLHRSGRAPTAAGATSAKRLLALFAVTAATLSAVAAPANAAGAVQVAGTKRPWRPATVTPALWVPT